MSWPNSNYRHAKPICYPEVAERIGELLSARLDADASDTRTVIAALLRLAETAPTAANPEAIAEARRVLRDASELMKEFAKVREDDRNRVLGRY